MRTQGARGTTEPSASEVTVRLTVRYFAAARAAAGTESETLCLSSGTSVGALLDQLAARHEKLARVLERCSFLCDGVAVRDEALNLSDGQIIDVLPPFAGG